MSLDPTLKVGKVEPAEPLHPHDSRKPSYQGERNDLPASEKLQGIRPESGEPTNLKAETSHRWTVFKHEVGEFFNRIFNSELFSRIAGIFRSCLSSESIPPSPLAPSIDELPKPKFERRNTVFDDGAELDQPEQGRTEFLGEEKFSMIGEGEISLTQSPPTLPPPIETPVLLETPVLPAADMEKLPEEDEWERLLEEITRINDEVLKEVEEVAYTPEDSFLAASASPLVLNSKLTSSSSVSLSDSESAQEAEPLHSVIPPWGAVGIANRSNACYRISTLQALSVFEPFRQKLFAEIAQLPNEKNDQFEKRKLVIKALQTLISWKGAVEGTPDDTHLLMEADEHFRNLLFQRKISPEFQGDMNRQQDAAAFTHTLLNDLLGLELKEQITRIGRDRGQLYRRENPMATISPIVKIELGVKGESLEELIAKTFAPKLENLDGKNPWMPEDGVTIPRYESETKLAGEPPEILVLQLERYKFDGKNTTKDTSAVTLPKNGEIDLHEIYRSKEPIKYRLRSFVCHFGSTVRSGHYIAYVLEGEQWYRCDDSRVEKVSPRQVYDAQQIAYLYFFERK